MFAVLLALLAASAWGAADFAGGFFSRRWPSLSVLLVVEAAGLLTALLVVILTGDAFPDARHVLLAFVAGTAGVTGLALLYQAMALGTMSIVAPISATGVAVPVAVGIATGDQLTTVIVIGLALAVVGIFLAGQEAPEADAEEKASSRLALLLALGAALGFGVFFVAYDVASDGSVGWAILLSRLPAIPILGLIVWRARMPLPRGTDLVRLGGMGQLDCVATSLYAVAITNGPLSVVAVVGALFPVVTVLLARVVLHERLRAVQAAGVTAALIGVALVSAGSA